MENLTIISTSTPGIVTFDNFQDVKMTLETYIQETFEGVDYDIEGIKIATADRDELKKMRDVVTKKQKEIEKVYSAPYVSVEKMLKDLVQIIDVPYKRAKTFVDSTLENEKRASVMDYAVRKAETLGEVGLKIVESPAFFNKKWTNKTTSEKSIHDEIDMIIQNAAKDINVIQATGGENIPVLMARYYETLSMDGVSSFLENIVASQDAVDEIAVESENNVKGYKVLKIIATEDQMASIMDQLEIMGVDVEELEDGMPKPMEELLVPDFNTFVAFDIETTGTNGAANGDGEAKITEIGAVRVVNGEVVEKFDELANPGRDIVPRIARLTHITNEMVSDKPPVDEVIRRFYEFVGDSILVGHNIKSSDLRYICKAADKAGVHFDVPFLDTYILAKNYKEKMKWEKLNLSYLSEFYGFEHKEVHRAWSDAEVNAQIYFELQKLEMKE